MSRWTNFCKYFQVFFAIGVLCSLMVFSITLFTEKVYLDHNKVYQE